MIRDADRLLERLRAIHASLRDDTLAAVERSAHDLEQLAEVAGSEGGDTIFAIDRATEAGLLGHFEAVAREWPLLLVAEGLGETGQTILPHGASPEIVVIVDPIDGTRGFMYQKRPAWILTGVAPFSPAGARLSQIELAVQTEIPLLKQHLSDSLWVAADGQAGGERLSRLSGERQPLSTRPSRATTIEQGFGNLSRFFPGMRALLGDIDDRLTERLLGPMPPGRALSFEDQYISSGGQLFELMMGHDRWCADLRPLVWAKKGARGLCCHPYDLATASIAQAAGVIVTGARGEPLDAPLDAESDVAWIGYANDAIRRQVEPALQALLAEYGL